jgi:hypothetical protein
MRDDGYEERSAAACNEFDMYEHKPDGTMGAQVGQHDDYVISRAGALWLSGQMDPVKEIDAPKAKVRRYTGAIIGPGGLPTKGARV